MPNQNQQHPDKTRNRNLNPPQKPGQHPGQDTPKQYLDDEDEAQEGNGRSNTINPQRDPDSKRPQPAKGDDDLMSKQQTQAMPSADSLKGKWKQQVGAAKIAWGKLTEDEILKSEGHEQKLAGLVQERYALTRDEAEKQVKAFVSKLKH